MDSASHTTSNNGGKHWEGALACVPRVVVEVLTQSKRFGCCKRCLSGRLRLVPGGNQARKANQVFVAAQRVTVTSVEHVVFALWSIGISVTCASSQAVRWHLRCLTHTSCAHSPEAISNMSLWRSLGTRHEVHMPASENGHVLLAAQAGVIAAA
jgi:hypothetical protein